MYLLYKNLPGGTVRIADDIQSLLRFIILVTVNKSSPDSFILIYTSQRNLFLLYQYYIHPFHTQ